MDLLKPIRLCHLLIFTACKLKVFGDDAFGKVTSRCKVAASVMNFLLQKNRVFFPVTAGHQRIPARVRLINQETFKAAVVDIVKCIADANLQRHYVGDGAGDVAIAGLGLPPSALTDGTAPSAEILFKHSLHDLKGLLDSKAYLKNPDSAEAAAARHEAIVLDGINTILAGGQIAAARAIQESQNAGSTTNNSANNNTTGNDNNPNTTESNTNNNNNIRGSPTVSLLTADDNSTGKLKRSPATMMAEASLLSQEAALKEADNLKQMIEVQKEEMQLRKQDAELHREERKIEMNLLKAERENTTKVLSKLVDKLCPDMDPTELFTTRKRKLDEARNALGEDLYNLRLQQLRDEFLKSAAF